MMLKASGVQFETLRGSFTQLRAAAVEIGRAHV